MKLGKKNGLTLVEVMISVLILGVTLSGFAMAFMACQKGESYANNRDQSIHRCRSRMETLLSQPYTHASLSNGVYSFSGGYYTVATNSAAANLKTISVTVNWADQARSASGTVNLVTCMSDAIH